MYYGTCGTAPPSPRFGRNNLKKKSQRYLPQALAFANSRYSCPGYFYLLQFFSIQPLSSGNSPT